MANPLESKFPKEDRVRNVTSERSLERIDAETEHCVHALAGKSKSAITARIKELDEEWDIERYLQMNASSLALTGIVLSLVSRKGLFMSSVVLAFLLQHALQGWCPPVPVFRLFGIRTRQEIERERYALKALRGDFDEFTANAKKSGETRAVAALDAAEMP